MSMVFLYNTQCTWNPKTGKIEFKELAWMMPIEALTKITMTEYEGKKVDLNMVVDLECQNQIIAKHGLKKITKSERNVEFNVSRKTIARDFLWNLRRIHHWWNYAAPSGHKNNNKALIINTKNSK